MIKKVLAVFLLIGTLLAGTSAFAATSTASPVTSVQTYNDFPVNGVGDQIRLEWKPTYGAASYNVYLAKGYNVRSGFIFQHNVVKNAYNYVLDSNIRQYVIQDYVQSPTLGWYTVEVTAVDSSGVESTPCYASVNVLQ